MDEVAIIAIPFLGTSLGAAMVFGMKAKMNPGLERILLGFASGVMIAASVWSLLIPAMEMSSEQGKTAWVPGAAGVLAGVFFLLMLDHLVSRMQGADHILDTGTCSAGNEATGCSRQIGAPNSSRKVTMLVLAVILHNLPEGMAVGVALAGAMTANTGITMAGAMMLSAGIAIQNLPEGAIISMPLRNEGWNRSGH